jgi:hypothetical protein
MNEQKNKKPEVIASIEKNTLFYGYFEQMNMIGTVAEIVFLTDIPSNHMNGISFAGKCGSNTMYTLVGNYIVGDR